MDLSHDELMAEKRAGKWAKIKIGAYHAAFGSVLLPAQAYLDNSALTKLHRFIALLIVFGVLYMAIGGRRYYLETVPMAYPLWESGTDAGFKTLITNQIAGSAAGSDFCDAAENNKYAYFYEASGLGFSAKDFSCVDSSHFQDDELPRAAATGEAFYPTYFAESWETRKVTTSDCTTLQGACPTNTVDWDANVPGTTRFVDLGQVNGEGTCKCEQRPKHYFTTGIEEKLIYLRHSMTVDAEGHPLTVGVAGLEPDLATEAGSEPILTIIQYFDKTAKKWAEADCSGSSWVAQENSGGCRFEKVPGFKMSDWLSIGNVGSLNDVNQHIAFENTETTYDGKTLNANPSFRVSGLQLVVQLKYLDTVYQPASEPWYKETPEKKPKGQWSQGTICYVLVSANSSLQTREEVKLESAPSTPNGDGRARRRTYSGILMSAVGSTDSKFGYVSMALLVSFLSTGVVYIQFAALCANLVAIKVLGETSRNYERFLRMRVKTGEMAARTTPVKCFMAAITFMFMREWEEDEIGAASDDNRSHGLMKYHLDNDDEISEKTIYKLLHRAFPYRVFQDMREEDFQNMAEAAFVELGGHVDEDDNAEDNINLLEWVEGAVSGETVDYVASKAAFNPRSEQYWLEKKFGDNVKSYGHAQERIAKGHHHGGHKRHHVHHHRKMAGLGRFIPGQPGSSAHPDDLSENASKMSSGSPGGSKIMGGATNDKQSADSAPTEKMSDKDTFLIGTYDEDRSFDKKSRISTE